MDKKISEAIAKKTAFVVAMNQIESVRVSKIKMEEIAHNLGLSTVSAEKAYLNVTNSGDTRVDRRVKYMNPEYDCKATFAVYTSPNSDKYAERAKANKKKIWSIASRDITISEMAKTILDVMTTNKRLYEVLYENNINYYQYYSALFELEVYGTLMGKKIFSYNKFNKFALKELIHLYKYPNGNAIKNLDLVEISTRMRAANILKAKLQKIAMSK